MTAMAVHVGYLSPRLLNVFLNVYTSIYIMYVLLPGILLAIMEMPSPGLHLARRHPFCPVRLKLVQHCI